MRKPKVNRRYILVRVIEGRIEQAEFIRCVDDSVSVIAEGRYCGIEFTPDAWKTAWASLEERGYIELREARASGLIPQDWAPQD